jgi:hypothetical protein
MLLHSCLGRGLEGRDIFCEWLTLVAETWRVLKGALALFSTVPAFADDLEQQHCGNIPSVMRPLLLAAPELSHECACPTNHRFSRMGCYWALESARNADVIGPDVHCAHHDRNFRKQKSASSLQGCMKLEPTAKAAG